MYLQGGHAECAVFGALLDISEDDIPTITVRAASGEPNMRVLTHRFATSIRCHRKSVAGVTTKLD